MPKAPDTATTAPEVDLVEKIMTSLYRADQLDKLHLSIINLNDMLTDGELELILEQVDKSTQQKQLFLDKVVAGVLSPELRTVLKVQNQDFFLTRNLEQFLTSLRSRAEHCAVVKLTVAVEFRESDLREMASLLSEKLGKQVVLSLKVEPSLIGGAVVQHGSYVSDYSLKTQLELFRADWRHAVVES